LLNLHRRHRGPHPLPTRRSSDLLGAESAADALALVRDATGSVDLDQIADLLGTSTADAREQLRGMVFDDPDGGELVPADEYLSGDRKSTRLNSSHVSISYAVFCL